MTKKILASLFLLAIITLYAFDLPINWHIAGSKPKSYQMGLDKGSGQDGKTAATIKSIDKKIEGFGTLMQSCSADKFHGKRVRMSGYIKSENVVQWAGLWLRVDQQGSTKSLSFDNMSDRPVKGTTGWQKYEIVLDVPATASALAYGALLSGTGQIWFDNITFEIVDNSVKTTGKNGPSGLSEPTNLDFETK
jgi:hypothetical protein